MKSHEMFIDRITGLAAFGAAVRRAGEAVRAQIAAPVRQERQR